MNATLFPLFTLLAVTGSVSAALAPPSGLVYSPQTIQGNVGVAISPATPTSTGGLVVAYSLGKWSSGASQVLPAGLKLDSKTGIISGVPVAVKASTTFTVVASNAAGKTTSSFSISVAATIWTKDASASL